jgi:hypothetical protein
MMKETSANDLLDDFIEISFKDSDEDHPADRDDIYPSIDDDLYRPNRLVGVKKSDFNIYDSVDNNFN